MASIADETIAATLMNQSLLSATEDDAEGASVGVLGWLGFIIINFAAWGIIGVASAIAWFIGFAFCFVYTAVLITGAICLERRGPKYQQFVNLLWVMGTWFVFILGFLISVNVLWSRDGTGNSDSGSGSTEPGFHGGDLLSLLPSNASQELLAWAGNMDYAAKRSPTFALFAGSVFFGGLGPVSTSTDSKSDSILWHAAGASSAKVQPELRDPACFTEFQSSLYFVADSLSGGAPTGLWRIKAADVGSAVIVKEATAKFNNFDSLHVDASASKLYFKGTVECEANLQWVDTIFSSDGTTEGTVDLRPDPCSSFNSTSPLGGSSSDGKPPLASLWGVLFLAVLPMVLLASAVLVWKKMPGLFVNLFGGVISAVVTIYLMVHYDEDTMSGLPSFLKEFITIYTSILWVAIIVWSLLKDNLPVWQEDLKSWAVAVVGVSFAIITHVDLEIPFHSEAWRWVVYTLVALLQMIVSSAVSRTVPMVTGAIGIFVVSWKVAYELVEVLGIRGSELMTLAMLAFLALQGIGIIVAAVLYAGNRKKIDAMVRSVLTCGRRL